LHADRVTNGLIEPRTALVDLGGVVSVLIEFDEVGILPMLAWVDGGSGVTLVEGIRARAIISPTSAASIRIFF